MGGKMPKIIAGFVLFIAGYMLFFTSREVINLDKQINTDMTRLLAHSKIEIIKNMDFSKIKEGSLETQRFICNRISFYSVIKVKTKNSIKKRINVEVVWLESNEKAVSMVRLTRYITKKRKSLQLNKAARL